MHIKRLFTVSEGEKLTEKVFGRVLVSSICSILLCMTCLAGTTWAWFAVSIENQGNVIQIATVTAEVSVFKVSDKNTQQVGGEGTQQVDGEGTQQSGDESTQQVGGESESRDVVEKTAAGNYSLTEGTYEIDIALKSDGSGTDDLNRSLDKVYAVMTVTDESSPETYYSYYLELEKNAEAEKIVFPVNGKNVTISFDVSWIKPIGAEPYDPAVFAVEETPEESTEETSTETTAEETTEAPTEVTTEESTEATTEAPTEATSKESTEATTQEPTEATTEESTEATTEEPTEATSEESTEVTTEEPTEEATRRSTEATTEEFTEETKAQSTEA